MTVGCRDASEAPTDAVGIASIARFVVPRADSLAVELRVEPLEQGQRHRQHEGLVIVSQRDFSAGQAGEYFENAAFDSGRDFTARREDWSGEPHDIAFEHWHFAHIALVL